MAMDARQSLTQAGRLESIRAGQDALDGLIVLDVRLDFQVDPGKKRALELAKSHWFV